MPVHYTLSGNLFRMELAGTYPPDEIIRTFRAALRDPRFPQDPRFIFDVRQSKVLAKRDPGSVRAIAQFMAEHSSQVGHRCAIVTATPAQFGLSRMAATVVGLQGAEVRVFTTTQDAARWLGCEEETGDCQEPPDTSG